MNLIDHQVEAAGKLQESSERLVQEILFFDDETCSAVSLELTIAEATLAAAILINDLLAHMTGKEVEDACERAKTELLDNREVMSDE